MSNLQKPSKTHNIAYWGVFLLLFWTNPRQLHQPGWRHNLRPGVLIDLHGVLPLHLGLFCWRLGWNTKQRLTASQPTRPPMKPKSRWPVFQLGVQTKKKGERASFSLSDRVLFQDVSRIQLLVSQHHVISWIYIRFIIYNCIAKQPASETMAIGHGFKILHPSTSYKRTPTSAKHKSLQQHGFGNFLVFCSPLFFCFPFFSTKTKHNPSAVLGLPIDFPNRPPGAATAGRPPQWYPSASWGRWHRRTRQRSHGRPRKPVGLQVTAKYRLQRVPCCRWRFLSTYLRASKKHGTLVNPGSHIVV